MLRLLETETVIKIQIRETETKERLRGKFCIKNSPNGVVLEQLLFGSFYRDISRYTKLSFSQVDTRYIKIDRFEEFVVKNIVCN